MKEIELKILEINEEKIVNKLKTIGAKHVGTCFSVDKAFDFPDKRIKKAGDLLRLRTMGDKVELCYKDNRQEIDGFQIADEYEVNLTDYKTAEVILNKIGVKAYRRREKIRTTYEWDDLKFEIDKYPEIPAYMEIEGSKGDINVALKDLGYTIEDTTNITATQVLKQYGADHNKQKFSAKQLKERDITQTMV